MLGQNLASFLKKDLQVNIGIFCVTKSRLHAEWSHRSLFLSILCLSEKSVLTGSKVNTYNLHHTERPDWICHLIFGQLKKKGIRKYFEKSAFWGLSTHIEPLLMPRTDQNMYLYWGAFIWPWRTWAQIGLNFGWCQTCVFWWMANQHCCSIGTSCWKGW